MKFEKKCLFNRTTVLGPNGVQNLTVPVLSTGGKPTPLSEIRICYQQDWIRVHTGSLVAAYNSSPFFTLFKDELLRVYASRPEFLFELNEGLNAVILGRLNKSTRSLPHTEQPIGGIQADHRHLKDLTSIRKHLPPISSYPQVFSDRFPFTPYLSWIDWLSNTGGA